MYGNVDVGNKMIILYDIQMFTVQPTEAELITSDESSGGE